MVLHVQKEASKCLNVRTSTADTTCRRSPDTAVGTEAKPRSSPLRCPAGQCTEPSARPCGGPPEESKTLNSPACPGPPNSPPRSQPRPERGRHSVPNEKRKNCRSHKNKSLTHLLLGLSKGVEVGQHGVPGVLVLLPELDSGLSGENVLHALSGGLPHLNAGSQPKKGKHINQINPLHI